MEHIFFFTIDLEIPLHHSIGVPQTGPVGELSPCQSHLYFLILYNFL